MKRSIAATVGLLFVAALLSVAQTVPEPPTTAPAPADARPQRVLLISIDGLRPDIAMRAEMPALRTLMRRGSYSLWARTTPVAITLPSHVTMMTGCRVEKHGITFNDERATTQPMFVPVPTLFDIAHQAGLSTALVSGKSKFVLFNRPGMIDTCVVSETATQTTGETLADALTVIAKKPQFMALHFPGVDNAGHKYGWGSKEQIEQVEQADAALAAVVEALQSQGVLEQTTILITADHGGYGRVHGKDSAPSRHIPWVIAGPGIRRDYDLTLDRELVIDTQDTFATLCWLMNLPIPADQDGKPIVQILEPPAELLK